MAAGQGGPAAMLTRKLFWMAFAAGCGASSAGPTDAGSGGDVSMGGDSGGGGIVDASPDQSAEASTQDAQETTSDAETDAGMAAAPHTLANVGWGMFNDHGEGSWASDLSQVEGVTGRHMDIVMDYQDWSSGTAAWPTMSSQVIGGIGGRPMMWTVQPSGVNWPSLVAGDYDSEIIAFADWVNTTLHSTIYVRFAHEQNGTGWYNWQVGGSCGVTSATDYVQGFNHVASVLKSHSTYILMVWAANNGPTDNIASFYPSGCDIMGFDSYNFGPNTSSSDVSAGGAATTWAEASALNAAAYSAVASCDPNKPIWICETSSEEPSAPWNPTTYDPSGYPNNIVIAAQPGFDKGEWVTKFLSETDMPRISMVVWFDIQKERNWLFDSSTSSKNAFYSAFSQSRGGGVYWNPVTGGL
jgi:hypothetical protein